MKSGSKGTDHHASGQNFEAGEKTGYSSQVGHGAQESGQICWVWQSAYPHRGYASCCSDDAHNTGEGDGVLKKLKGDTFTCRQLCCYPSHNSHLPVRNPNNTVSSWQDTLKIALLFSERLKPKEEHRGQARGVDHLVCGGSLDRMWW